MGILDSIKNTYSKIDKNVFGGKLPGGYVSSNTSTITPTKSSVKVTDFSSGESVTKITTTPSSTSNKSSGGSSSRTTYNYSKSPEPSGKQLGETQAKAYAGDEQSQQQVQEAKIKQIEQTNPEGIYEVTIGGQSYSVKGNQLRQFSNQQVEIQRQEQIKKYNEQERQRDPFGLTPRRIVRVKQTGTFESPRGYAIPLTTYQGYDYTTIGDFSYYKESNLTEEEKKIVDEQIKTNYLNSVPETERNFSNLYGAKESLLKFERGVQQRNKTGASSLILFGTGFAKPFVETGIAIANPIQTTKGLVSSALNPINTITRIKSETSEAFKYNPVGATGSFLGYAAVYNAPKLITKGVDTFRVRKTIRLAEEEVIAPERAFQTYPQIRRGQTAGELLSEFNPPEQYGVTSLRGLSATPKPFKSETVAAAGSSEIKGVYVAPKLNPQFLRVSGEGKLFSLKVLDTLRPTALKIETSTGYYELSPLVNPSQTNFASISATKKFYETAPKGRGYVTFVKSEKEAIIPFGTQLIRTGKRFSFTTEGRKIPLQEYRAVTIEELNTGRYPGKLTTAGKVYSKYYSNSKRSVGYINPYSSAVTSSVIRTYSSRGYSPTSTYKLPSYSSSAASSSKVSYKSYLRSYPSSSVRKSYSPSKISYRATYSGGSSSGGLVNSETKLPFNENTRYSYEPSIKKLKQYANYKKATEIKLTPQDFTSKALNLKKLRLV